MILPVRGATRDVGVMSGMQWHWLALKLSQVNSISR